jgi:hypothetical protein
MWAMFDDEGRISVTYQGQPNQTAAQLEEIYGNNFIEGASDGSVDWENTWVNNGVLEDKASLTATWDATTVAADGVTEIVLSGLPTPCTVLIDYMHSVEVTDGSLEFTADAPGTYSLVVDEVAYTRQEWTVDAI